MDDRHFVPLRFVADLKLGLPVPEGFWACILPRKSSLSGGVGVKERALLFQDLRPFRRSRPVRIFGVCGESRKAGQRFVWEVRCGEGNERGHRQSIDIFCNVLDRRNGTAYNMVLRFLQGL